MEFKKVKIKDLQTNQIQPEWRTDGKQLQTLLHSIKENGLFEPIAVRKISNGYEIINGHRRTECFRVLGLLEIDAVIHTKIDSMVGFMECNTTAKPIRRKDYVSMYLKGATPPRRVMNYLIIIVDKLGKDFVEKMSMMNISAEVIVNYIEVAKFLDIIEPKEVEKFVSWGIEHRCGFVMKSFIKNIREYPRGKIANKIRTSFLNNEPIKLSL